MRSPTFTTADLELICIGLDMVREEREDELDVLIEATTGPDHDRVTQIRRTYEEKKSQFGIFITRLKQKVKKIKT